MKHVLLVLALVGLVSCTQNQRARQFGGTSTIQIAPCQKVVTATWKENSLWTLTRAARPGELAETHTFKEDSSAGLIEGKVIFVEKIDDSCFKK